MKKRILLLVGAVLGLALVANLLAFQVQFNEVAVVTTFGKPGPNSVKSQAGFYFRLPDPIQSVFRFPTRLQVLDDQFNELTLSDGNNVIIRASLTSRIDPQHPLDFFNRFPNYRPDFAKPAEDQLKVFLADVKSIVSQYSLSQLVNTDDRQVKQDEIEARALKQIQERLASGTFGIDAQRVNLRRIVLPQAVTSSVFDRMKASLEKQAADVTGRANAEANTIQDSATAVAARVLSFADSRASLIRAQGDRAAAEYVGVFKANEDLAIFLRKIDTLKKILKDKTTLILDASQLSPLDMLRQTPTPPDGSGTTGRPPAQPPRGP